MPMKLLSRRGVLPRVLPLAPVGSTLFVNGDCLAGDPAIAVLNLNPLYGDFVDQNC
jgi:hypothetical protein